MIFAKEKPDIARAILGNEVYKELATKSGVAGGRGHELYKIYRSLPLKHPDRILLESESKSYYDLFR